MGNLIERIAVAWLRHQGYTDADLARVPLGEIGRATHEAMGCEFDGNHQGWDCTNENGESNHPTWDAITEASEIAHAVVETLGATCWRCHFGIEKVAGMWVHTDRAAYEEPTHLAEPLLSGTSDTRRSA